MPLSVSLFSLSSPQIDEGIGAMQMANEISQNSWVNDDDRDRSLQELALAAQQQPPQTDRRRVALNRLWQGILQSNRLGHPQQGRWSPTLYCSLD